MRILNKPIGRGMPSNGFLMLQAQQLAKVLHDLIAEFSPSITEKEKGNAHAKNDLGIKSPSHCFWLLGR